MPKRTIPVEILGQEPATLHVKTACEGSCLLVVARAWAPGWHALVDDVEVPLVRANLAGMGVVVPDGRHEVDLRYRPWPW